MLPAAESPRRRAHALLTLALVLGLATAIVVGPAPARARPRPEKASLTLQRQPPWHGPKDRLALRFRVHNEGSRALDGFRIFVSAYGRILSRSGLHGSFDEPEGLQIDSFTDLHRSQRIPGGATEVVSVGRKVSELLSTEDEAGVYPLTVSLRSVDNERELDTLTTQLVYYPTEPNEPLNLALVVQLQEAPARGPNGVFEADPETERFPLEDAVADTGWLRAIVSGIRSGPPNLRLGLAPTPRLIEELGDMEDGYVRGEPGNRVSSGSPAADEAESLLNDVRALLRDRTRVEPMVVPYSYADLPSLIDHIDASLDHPAEQLKEGKEVIKEVLDTDLEEDRWLLAPDGRLDAATLDHLAELQATVTTGTRPRVVLGDDALEEQGPPARSGCPAVFASFACPVSLETTEGRARGLVSDEGLQERLSELAHRGDARLNLQQFFAETAMIREEVPGVAGRVVQATTPTSWRPSPGIAAALFSGIARAPWLTTRTPSGAWSHAAKTEDRRVVESLGRARSEPPGDYFEAIDEAAKIVKRFEGLEPPEGLVNRLRHNILAAESRSWWEEGREQEGAEYAVQTHAAVTSAFSNITIRGVNKVTLTSRSDDLPLYVVNKNAYPVSVLVEMFSDRSLDLARTEIPLEAAAQKINPIRVRVSSGTSGTFPLEARLETSRGWDFQERAQISVRSTQFNRVALTITIGALIFLIAFYVLRGMRGRRKSSATEQSATV